MDFYRVIDFKSKQWKGTKYATMLRPQTLFGKTNSTNTYMNQELQKTDSKNSQIALNERNPLFGEWLKTDIDYAVARTYNERNSEATRGRLTLIVELMAQWKVHLGVTGEFIR